MSSFDEILPYSYQTRHSKHVLYENAINFEDFKKITSNSLETHTIFMR